MVPSYLYQVHLYHWLESNDYGRFLADNDLSSSREHRHVRRIQRFRARLEYLRTPPGMEFLRTTGP